MLFQLKSWTSKKKYIEEHFYFCSWYYQNSWKRHDSTKYAWLKFRGKKFFLISIQFQVNMCKLYFWLISQIFPGKHMWGSTFCSKVEGNRSEKVSIVGFLPRILWIQSQYNYFKTTLCNCFQNLYTMNSYTAFILGIINFDDVEKHKWDTSIILLITLFVIFGLQTQIDVKLLWMFKGPSLHYHYLAASLLCC